MKVAVQRTQRTGLGLRQTYHTGIRQRHWQIGVTLHQGRDGGSLALYTKTNSKYSLCQLGQDTGRRDACTGKKKATLREYRLTGGHRRDKSCKLTHRPRVKAIRGTEIRYQRPGVEQYPALNRTQRPKQSRWAVFDA